METDRIEKHILLRAPRSRVWRALTDAAEFGSWFGMRFEGGFAPGARVRGVIVPTTVDATVAESGFDKLPLARRAKAFHQNEQGWSMAVTLIEKHLAHAG